MAMMKNFRDYRRYYSAALKIARHGYDPLCSVEKAIKS
jgi:hypothetical protein